MTQKQILKFYKEILLSLSPKVMVARNSRQERSVYL